MGLKKRGKAVLVWDWNGDFRYSVNFEKENFKKAG